MANTWVFLPWEPHEQYEKTKRLDTESELSRLVGAQYTMGDQWRNNSREETESKQQQHPAVDVTGDGSKVRCCKEQCCIGTWNVRSMNQGKLGVVKQEMARVNHRHFRNEWTKMGWNGWITSDDCCIYYCSKNFFSLQKKWSSPESTKESEIQYLGAVSKMTEWSRFTSKANHSISQ